MSKDYPDHPADCPCSGCYASNGEQRARNRAIEEAALEAERWANGRPGYVVDSNVRGCLNDFAEHLRSLKWYHPHATGGPLLRPADGAHPEAP